MSAPQVLVSGPCVHATPDQLAPGLGGTAPSGESHPLRPYWEYLAYLFRKLPAIPDELRQEMEYRDYLQAPLQPLQA
ncbi:protein arginine N-methyltransferase, partial [Haematococcus lacustris]